MIHIHIKPHSLIHSFNNLFFQLLRTDLKPPSSIDLETYVDDDVTLYKERKVNDDDEDLDNSQQYPLTIEITSHLDLIQPPTKSSAG